MNQPKPEKLSAFDLAEGMQLGHAVAALHELRILDAIGKPATAAALAKKFRLDAGLLEGILEFVAARTNLVSKKGKRFNSTREYTRQSRFLLGLYTGAYGGNAVRLPDLLRRPSLAPEAVDAGWHARAFEEVSPTAAAGVPEIIRQLGFNRLLDIGCGPAALLLELAERDPEFFGWGLEPNPAMCKVARARIREAGAGKRVKLLKGESNQLDSVLTPGVRAKIETVSACQVANQMFGNGIADAVAWLREIRVALPGRPMLVADYYGRLGKKGSGWRRETLLHDYAQLISGQGVPPATLKEWRRVYSEAGCPLVHVIEDTGTTRFIHIIVL